MNKGYARTAEGKGSKVDVLAPGRCSGFAILLCSRTAYGIRVFCDRIRRSGICSSELLRPAEELGMRSGAHLR